MTDQKQSSVVDPIRFPEELDYRTVDAVRTQVLANLDLGRNGDQVSDQTGDHAGDQTGGQAGDRSGDSGVGQIVCDVSCVERVSTPGVQLLLSIAATAESHDFDFQLTGTSSALNEAVETLGLKTHFQEWMNFE